jgi:hypothetical protein
VFRVRSLAPLRAGFRRSVKLIRSQIGRGAADGRVEAAISGRSG